MEINLLGKIPTRVGFEPVTPTTSAPSDYGTDAHPHDYPASDKNLIKFSCFKAPAP